VKPSSYFSSNQVESRARVMRTCSIPPVVLAGRVCVLLGSTREAIFPNQIQLVIFVTTSVL